MQVLPILWEGECTLRGVGGGEGDEEGLRLIALIVELNKKYIYLVKQASA